MSDLKECKKAFASEVVYEIGYVKGFKYYMRYPELQEISKHKYDAIRRGDK